MEPQGAPSPGPTLTIDELSELREKTEKVSALLRARLEQQLETLRPILAPSMLLGKHARGGEKSYVPQAEKAFEELKERFAAVCGSPFNLPKQLQQDPVTLDGRVVLYPWLYTAKLGAEGKAVTMTSPVKWVANYRCGYTLEQIRQAGERKESLRPDEARDFALGALALGALLEGATRLRELLGDLRWEVRTETCDGLGRLPLVTFTAALRPFRPADDLILAATRFSGVNEFIELIDQDAVRGLEDPLRRRIGELLA
jgi:hypothetical protein